MPLPADLQPGDFFVTRTNGWVGEVIRELCRQADGEPSPVNHAGIYIGNGQIVEAEPKSPHSNGARIGHASQYPDAIWSTGKIALIAPERGVIVRSAKAFVGTRYGYLDIVALAMRETLGWSNSWINSRIERTDRLICSQLVDRCYAAAGVRLFRDQRLTCEVTPEDLRRLIA